MLPGEIKAQDLHTLVTNQLDIPRNALSFTLHASPTSKVPIISSLQEAISRSTFTLDRECILSVEFFESSITNPQLEASISVPDWISCLATSPQGSLLVGSYDCKARLLQADKLSITNVTTKGPIKAACWIGSSDEYVLASMDKIITKCSLEKGKLESFSAPSNPSSVCFDSTSNSLAFALWDGNVHLKEKGLESQIICTHAGKATSIEFSQAGHLISAGWDSRVKVSDILTQKQLQTFTLSAAINAFCLPSANTIFTGLTNNRPELLDLRTSPTCTCTKLGGAHKGWISAVACKNDYILATASTDCTVKLWDLRGDVKNSIFTLDFKAKPLAVAFLPDGERLVCGGEDNLLSLYSLT